MYTAKIRIYKFDSYAEDKQDTLEYKLKDFMQPDQKKIIDEVKTQVDDFKKFCARHDAYYLDRIKSFPSCEGRVKAYQDYCDKFGHMRSRVKDAVTTIDEAQISVQFMSGDVEKLNDGWNSELTNGFFSAPIDITLSNGEYILMF